MSYHTMALKQAILFTPIAMGAMLLAVEAAAANIPTLTDITGITSVGFAMWYGFYVTRYALPNIITQHKQVVDGVNEAHKVDTDRLITSNKDNLDMLATSFNKHSTDMTAQHMAFTQAIRTDFLAAIKDQREAFLNVPASVKRPSK